MSFILIKWKFVVAIGSIHDLLVELQVGSAVTDIPIEVIRATFQVIDTVNQVHNVVIQFEEVHVVVFQMYQMTIFIIFRTNEDLYDGLLALI
ncbi:hypothetical protein CVS40_6161 [Lucilia cuprina]|nr:hypothetical protein CVS40_6161 [Lucilia cuprina]